MRQIMSSVFRTFFLLSAALTGVTSLIFSTDAAWAQDSPFFDQRRLPDLEFERRNQEVLQEQRRLQDAEAKRKADEQRLAVEAEAKKKVEEQRLAAEAEAKKKVEEQRIAAEAEAKKKAE